MVSLQAFMRTSKGRERALKLRALHFPDVTDGQLWHRKRNHGFSTLPRTLPIIMNIIDAQSKNKPAGRAYLGLWMRTFDEGIVIIENPMSLASEAGFTGERAVTTWKDRMATLKKMGFIDARAGSSGDYHYVLLYNPHKVVWKLRSKIQQRYFMQLVDRAAEIGATDMDDTPAAPPVPPAAQATLVAPIPPAPGTAPPPPLPAIESARAKRKPRKLAKEKP